MTFLKEDKDWTAGPNDCCSWPRSDKRSLSSRTQPKGGENNCPICQAHLPSYSDRKCPGAVRKHPNASGPSLCAWLGKGKSSQKQFLNVVLGGKL